MSRGLGAMGRRIEPKRPVSDRRRRHARALFVAAACLLLLTGILAFIMVGMTRLDTTGCDLHPCIPPTLPAPGPWELTLAVGATLAGLLAAAGVVLSNSGGRSRRGRPEGASGRAPLPRRR
jgi:hypothetical protein